MYKIAKQHKVIALFFLSTDVTAIIYVVACSSYNLVLREDPSQVGLEHRIEIIMDCFILA